jgi:cation efflux system membrane fusion protein
MKRLPILSALLVISLATGTPAALGHAGHGDEFQAEGGVNRVEVNAQTDSLFGIQVSPIEPAPNGSSTVMIPMTALVEDNGRQLVFVQYENFYEPVPVTTGVTQGELIEITEGLSVGEQLVTQGSLSLYAESRKTQTAEAEAAETTTTATTEESPESVIAEVEPTETKVEVSEGAEETAETTEASSGFPIGWIAALGAGAALIVGAVVFLGGGKKGSV